MSEHLKKLTLENTRVVVRGHVFGFGVTKLYPLNFGEKKKGSCRSISIAMKVRMPLVALATSTTEFVGIPLGVHCLGPERFRSFLLSYQLDKSTA